MTGHEVAHPLVGREQHAAPVRPAPHHVGERSERGAEPPTSHDAIARRERRTEDVAVELHGDIVTGCPIFGAT